MSALPINHQRLALSLFWRAFEDHLLDQKPPVMTYNRMFALFSEHSPENLKLLSDEGRRVQLTREGLFVSDALWPELL